MDSRKEGLDKIVGVLGANLQKVRKWESRMGTDTELKLADILRYYTAESDAAKDLLYRYALNVFKSGFQICA